MGFLQYCSSFTLTVKYEARPIKVNPNKSVIGEKTQTFVELNIFFKFGRGRKL